MKRIVCTLILLLCAVPLMAQVQGTNTTLNLAIADGRLTTNVVQLVSNTGVVVRSGQNINTYLVVDREVMPVLDMISISTCTTNCSYTVTRGYRTTAMPHQSTSIVWVMPPSHLYDNFLRGQCTPSTVDFPRIVMPPHAPSGENELRYEFCAPNTTAGPPTTGVWKEATVLDETPPLVQVCSVPVGSVAYGSFGTSTADTSGTPQFVDIFVPYTQQFTGLKVLQGSTNTNDKWIHAVWDAVGNLLANSALAGATTSGSANTFFSQNFTSKIVLPGPARYFVGFQSNGTMDTYRLIASSTFPDKLSNVASSGTFGTLSSITIPTSDNTKGPIACLF